MNAGMMDYYFSQDGLFVIPIEHLTQAGMSDELAAEIQARGWMDVAGVELFNRAFSTYWERAQGLHERAPHYWMPPRVQHVCLITRPDYIRPYFPPFTANSWLLYASDFDPAASSPELATYHILHAERMAVMGQVDPVLATNLSYFLTLDEAALADLKTGCERCDRPDAGAYRALGETLSSLDQVFHESLKPPPVELADATHLPDTGLIVPASLHQALGRLQQAWVGAAGEAFQRHLREHAIPSPEGAQRIINWLMTEAPPILVTGEEWAILWDPEAPDEVDALRAALEHVSVSGSIGILDDLKVVARHSIRFLAALTTPDELVDPAPYITEGGLSYIHKDRKLIAYHIGGGENEGRIWQPTPPFERFMLAARTVHEWGHLAAESDWIIVPESRRAERQALEERMVLLFEAIYASAPEAIQQVAAEEVEEMRRKSGSLGQALLKRMLIRIEDFTANLLAQRFLSQDAMDTYIRNNVGDRFQDYSSGAIYNQLCRQIYELQYLKLSRIEDPIDWFLKSTWFRQRFIDNEVITESLFEELVEVIGKICECYAIDESRFDFTALVDA